MKWKSWVGAAAACVLLAGCASAFVPIAPKPPAQYAKLGPAKGSACGSLGILGTAYYFVPMALNSRMADAYKDAVASVSGATALIDVTVEEDWYWWVIGTARCVTVTGEAIK